MFDLFVLYFSLFINCITGHKGRSHMFFSSRFMWHSSQPWWPSGCNLVMDWSQGGTQTQSRRGMLSHWCTHMAWIIKFVGI